jgi:curved DNA-binding protein CbpA
MVDQPRDDPYHVLDIAHDASASQIKRRWRELAREHHPDRVAGDADRARGLTSRMARINAAYDLLSDPLRRARYDDSPAGRRGRAQHAAMRGRASFDQFDEAVRYGPPPPPPAPPVTARFDTSAAFRPRNTTLGTHRGRLSGQPPIARRRRGSDAELRASTPTGPVERRPGWQPEPLPNLRAAREMTLGFGRYRGYSLGEVELLDPGYLDWVAQTITRDRDIVVSARVILAELDRAGVERDSRPQAAGFGDRAGAG